MTNVLELELENATLYRQLAYCSDTWNYKDIAEFCYKKIYQLEPHLPQSLRDYALILAENGDYDGAMKLFNEILLGDWPDRFSEIEFVVLADIMSIMNKTKFEPAIKGIKNNFATDLRVVMKWDTDNTDIDARLRRSCNKRF